MLPPEEPTWQVLIPFDVREGICLKEAATRAGKSESTIRNWCTQRGIGRRVGGGAWVVSKVALAMFLDDDRKALNAYLAGDRAGPLVKPYFERVGVPVPKVAA
jgi:helix-turn-helix protein